MELGLRGLWFLAQLILSPSHQGRGIGNELLKRTFEHAEKSGATNRALITFTFNTVSQGLYIRNGLFPRFPIYNFRVAREDLMGRLQGRNSAPFLSGEQRQTFATLPRLMLGS